MRTDKASKKCKLCDAQKSVSEHLYTSSYKKVVYVAVVRLADERKFLHYSNRECVFYVAVVRPAHEGALLQPSSQRKVGDVAVVRPADECFSSRLGFGIRAYAEE
jgi:hypothetical protein